MMMLMVVRVVLVERPKICQRPKTGMEPPEKIFFLPKLGLHSPNYKRSSPKHLYFIILIWGVISGLKLVHQTTLFVESQAKLFRINFRPITWLQRTQIQISLSPKLANGTQGPVSPERWFLKRLATRLIIRSSWLSLKSSRLGATIWKAANTRSSFLLTKTISVNSWIQRAWAPDRSGRPRSSLDTIFASTTGGRKQIELQTLYPASPRGLLMRKPLYELRILRSYTVCRLH